MVLRILHEKMQAAHENFKALRKKHKAAYRQEKLEAKVRRKVNVVKSLQDEVGGIFKGI
jgi:hypothetical protein